MHLKMQLFYILLGFVVCTFADEQSDAELACGASTRPVVLTASEGYIESQNYPNNYEDDSNCQWLIQPSNVGSEQTLYIEIVEFSTEAPDPLEIYEGDSIYPHKFIFLLDGRYVIAGTIYPINVDVVTLWFHTDGSFADLGFRIRYYLAEKGPAQDISKIACSASTMPAVLTNESNFIESLNYPNMYPLVDCEWLIEPNTAFQGIYLSIISFYAYDYLLIYDNDSPTGDHETQWYGSLSKGTTALTTSGSMYLQFLPEYDSNPGFQLVYFAEPEACAGGAGHTLTATSKELSLTSPGYPYILPSYLTCRWIIRAPDDNQGIQLTVQAFDLHESEDCKDEYLEIFDGDEADALLLGRYCGDNRIGTIPSVNSAMQLYLRTRTLEDSIGKIGFSAIYSSGV